MTAYRVFRSSSSVGAASSPVLPMSKEDRSFWSIMRARKPHLFALDHGHQAVTSGAPAEQGEG